MANNTGIIIFAIVLVAGVIYLMSGNFPWLDAPNDNIVSGDLQTTQGILQRTVPVESDGSFQVKYSTEEPGEWGIIVVDTVSSNCKFSNGGTQYKSVMLYTAGNEQFVEVTGTNCEFGVGATYDYVTKEETLTNKPIGIQIVS